MTYVLSFYKANCTNQPQPSSNDSPYYIATPSARKQHKLILLNILKKLLDSSFFSRPLSTMSIRVFAFFNYTWRVSVDIFLSDSCMKYNSPS